MNDDLDSQRAPAQAPDLNTELLVGNLVAATVAECESHEQDESDNEKDAAADRFIRAKNQLLRALAHRATAQAELPRTKP